MKYLLIVLLLAGCVIEPGVRGGRDHWTRDNVCGGGRHCTQWITY